MISSRRNPDQRSGRDREACSLEKKQPAAAAYQVHFELVVEVTLLGAGAASRLGVILDEEDTLEVSRQVPLGKGLPLHHMK